MRPRSANGAWAMGHAEECLVRLAHTHGSALVIVLCIRLAGHARIPREALESGLLKVQARHPVLRCTVEVDQRGRYTLREDAALRVPVIDVHRGGSETWRELFHSHIDGQAMPVNGTSPHALYLIQSDVHLEREVVMVLQHFAGDGNSALLLLSRILEASLGPGLADLDAKSGNSSEPFGDSLTPTLLGLHHHTMTPHSEALLWPAAWAQLGMIGVARGLGVCALGLAQTFFNPLSPPALLPVAVPCSRVDHLKQNRTLALTDRLSTHDTGSLVQKCRRQGLTVGAAVCACVLSACAKWVDQKQRDVVATLATNLRDPAGVDSDVMSYFVGAIFVKLRPGPDLWATTLQVAEQIRAQKDGILTHGLLITSLIGNLPTLSGQATVMLSSWGAKSPLRERYGTWDVVCGDLAQSCHSTAYPTFDSFTIADQLTITLFGQVPRHSPEMLRGLLGDAVRCLRSMAATTPTTAWAAL